MGKIVMLVYISGAKRDAVVGHTRCRALCGHCSEPNPQPSTASMRSSSLTHSS
jgi:hypothetical protein